MIIVNDIEYANYFELCKAYEIEYKEFLEYKFSNKEMSELDILEHFIGHLVCSMKTGHYFAKEK